MAVALIFGWSCGPNGQRAVCYKERGCDTAVVDCMFIMSLMTGMFSSYSSPSGGSTYYVPESDNYNNDFSQMDYLPVYYYYSRTTYTGDMLNDNDKDFGYATSYGLVSSQVTLSVAQSSGSAICEAYTGSNLPSTGNDPSTTSLTFRAVLTSFPISINLNDVDGYLVIICSGTAQQTYTVDMDYNLTDPYSSYDLSSMTPFMMMMCTDAENSCRSECNKEYSY